MDDFIMYRIFKKNFGDMDDLEFMEKFREFIDKNQEESHLNESKKINSPLYTKVSDRHPEEFQRETYTNKPSVEYRYNMEHFNDSYAKYIVSNMYHYENGRKYSGEKFDMMKAKEVCDRYRGIIPSETSQSDVYVAINAQYHDYCELFKSWFGNDIEQRIIESAITFWFEDCDYKGTSKIWNYFKEE